MGNSALAVGVIWWDVFLIVEEDIYLNDPDYWDLQSCNSPEETQTTSTQMTRLNFHPGPGWLTKLSAGL